MEAWAIEKNIKDIKYLKSIKMPLDFYGEFKLYIDNDSFEIQDCGCGRCKEEYYDIAFGGYIIMKYSKKKWYFSDGRFKGYDNQCKCYSGPGKEVLCAIYRDYPEINDGNWMFQRYYVPSGKLVHKLINILTKGKDDSY